MRAVVLALLLTAMPAAAQDVAQTAAASTAGVTATQVKTGKILRDAEGKTLGRIDRVAAAADGSVDYAQIIYDGRFVRVPGNTLKVDGDSVTTSLPKAEVRKIK